VETRARLSRALAGAVLVGALICGAPTADPPPGERGARGVDLVVHARAPVGRLVPLWDELNLWKLDARFGVQHHEDPPPGWLHAAAPWVRYGRVVAALGGNYAAAIAPWCDYGTRSPEHPDTGTGECGHEGVPGLAAQNELVREVGGRTIVDYGPFRTAITRLLASGVRPHLNISAAPAAFTGGATDFSHYHWNAAPVRDLERWGAFVRGAFDAVRDLDPTGWRVSLLNEANCLTLVGWQQHRRHVGYAGSARDYGTFFAVTAAAVHAAAPGVLLHAGNYVTSATFPGEDNLARYLAALRDALAAGRDVQWSDLTALSLSLYETKDTSLYELVPVRLARAAAAERAAGLAARPFKIDELGIHPEMVAAFDADHAASLHSTLWAASWHAEALRQLIDAGTVVSVAPWLDRLFRRDPHTGVWVPYPAARIYALYALLAGQLEPVEGGGTLAFAETGRGDGLPRLAVTGGEPPPRFDAGPRPARLRSLAALATATPDGIRVVVVHHQGRPVPDTARLRRRDAREVTLRVSGLPPGAYATRHVSIGGAGGTRWNGRTTPLPRWESDGCRRDRAGALELVHRRPLEADGVWLFEVTRREVCP
jgi:hypothetical protein